MDIRNYHLATSLDDAQITLEADLKNVVFGGGTWLRQGKHVVETMVDLGALGLDRIEVLADNIRIGAMTTLRTIEKDEAIKGLASGMLAEAVARIMGINFRNLATIGGSVMGKYAFSDVLTPLLALEATLIFHNRPAVSLKDFLQEKKQSNDLLVGVSIPKKAGKGFFKKVSQTAVDFSILNVAIARSDTFRIVIGARPGVAALAEKAMSHLDDSESMTDERFEEVARIAADELAFSDNHQASKAYRQALAFEYVKRGLKEVCSK
jgi:CO/xanthine dehydrogenase FAD-binding subunit